MQTSAVRLIIAVTATLAAAFAQAEIIDSPHRIRATIAELGNGAGIRSDPHGQGGSSVASTESSVPLPPAPHGEVNQQIVTPFGSPQPPNQLTPAPVMPFHPNRPLLPAPSPAPSAVPNSGVGGGRFGR
jgi:hypothetical protein